MNTGAESPIAVLRYVNISYKRVCISELDSIYLFTLVVLCLPCCSQAFCNCREQGLLSGCRAWALGTEVQWVLCSDSGSWASVAVTPRPQKAQAPVAVAHGLQLLHGLWGLSGPRIEHTSPALAGELLSTVLPGKS